MAGRLQSIGFVLLMTWLGLLQPTLAEPVSLSAIELNELAPETLLTRLETARPTYDGSQPDELLQLLAWLNQRPGTPERPAIREAVLDLLGEWPDSLEPALEVAMASSDESLRLAAEQVRLALAPPADHPALDSLETAIIGRDYLQQYPGIPRVEPSNATILMTEVTIAQRDPFTADVQAAMAQVVDRGGLLLIAAPDAPEWPASLKRWAHTRGLALPGGHRPVLGPGLPAMDDYLSLATVPWAPAEQVGPPANAAWEAWSGRAPVRTSDGNGALVIVQQLGRATVLFTCLDLFNRPLYQDNLLYWIYGPALAEAQRPYPGEWDLAVTGSTPHHPWLKPLAGEPVKILYLTDNLFKRGMLELHQRLDVAYRYVPYQASPATLPAQPPQPPARVSLKTILAVQEALPWADVVYSETGRVNLLRSLVHETLGTVGLEILPRRLRRQLHAAFHSRGLGLVVAGTEKMVQPMTDTMARLAVGEVHPTQMPFLEETTCRIAPRGNGRLVWFSHPLEHLDFDYWRLAEDRLAAPWLVPGLEEEQQPVRVAEYTYAALARAMLLAAGRETPVGSPTWTGRAEFRLRNVYNTMIRESASDVAGGAASLAWPRLEHVPSIAERRLLDPNGHVVDIAARAFQPPAEPPIRRLETDRSWYAPGDTITARVHIAEATAGDLRVTVRDTWGRLIFAGQEPVAEIPVRHPLSRLWDIEAMLLDEDGRLLAYHRQPVGIVLPRRERDYRITGVLLKPDTLLPVLRDEMGIAVTFGDVETAFRANLELSAGTWSDKVGLSTTPGVRTHPTERQPCLSSPAFRLQAMRDMREKAPRWVRLGVTDYMIDDECPLGGRCLSPHSMRRFRGWLQRAYPDLASLNQEWGTEFASWDAVMPLEAANRERPGAMVDYDRFQRWEFAEYASYLQLLADDHLPGFQTGHSGGIKDNQMMQLASALWYYGVDEAAVAGKRPGALIGSWFAPGYRFREDHEIESRRWAWWHLFRGTTRQQLWYPKSFAPAIHGDLSRPYAAYTWLHEEMQDLQRGMGKLILQAERDEGRVAVYSSLRSRLTRLVLAELAGERKPPVHHGAAFQRSVLAAQAECRVINEFQVEAGALDRRGVRLLFLPHVLCLSERERQALSAFVEAGGVLIADHLPGARNEHGTLVDNSWAERLFTAENAVLLGADLEEDPARAAAWLELAGVTPRLQLHSDTGEPVAVDRGLFDDGQALYAGFVEDGNGMVESSTPRPITARFPAQAHLYDSRSGRYLGYGERVETTLQPGLAHLYAALPWRLDTITVPPATATPGDVLDLSITCQGEGAIGRQVLWVQLADPTGAWQPAYAQRLLVTGGTARLKLPLALSAEPGNWRLVVRDAATGVIGECTIEVRP